MSHSHRTDLQDPLGNRLRQEARQDRPDFSPELHDRILRAVREASSRPADAVPRRVRPGRLVQAMAVAATLLLAVMAGWRWVKPVRAQADPDLVAALETVTRVTRQASEDLVLLSDATTAGQRWAQLDQDLPLAMERLVGNLPRVP